ncbi:hypothetical protein BC1002_3001 [Paraburkholderia atlantica]|uniref:Uncharacterized protein n=1 Tax=Paraburkholderia atlantica TaxID=2654982 RepID=D5W6C5_PARAM|nr:hypothetical protein [Paraburkholderia atlantica]ADG17046.1 hypothetical protein BC1002_3001 [Paraburkholderia atlantica]
MDTGQQTFCRLVADVIDGRAHWTAKLPEREVHPAPLLLTAEDRRRYDAERKRRQRARRSGKPT